MERSAFRAMRGAEVVSLLITSFAVSEILKVLFQNGISPRPVPIKLPSFWSGTYEVASITIGVVPTVSVIVSLLALVGLTYVLRRTAVGLAMRAAAEDIEMLRLLGGLGSLGGAVLGGFVIGALEVLTQAFLPDSLALYRDSIVLAIVILVLLWRPNGLLAPAKSDRS